MGVAPLTSRPQSLILRLQIRDDAAIVGSAADRWAFAKAIDLMADGLHRIGHLIADRLILL
jgi:hypothetical protein